MRFGGICGIFGEQSMIYRQFIGALARKNRELFYIVEMSAKLTSELKFPDQSEENFLHIKFVTASVTNL